ncbi:6-phosphofructokinase [Corallococcus praedator]|uniref:ATP-dependent 6-phosphofructokinase n=1 Tax=Corallococcus praedator TaxID=2316724 RepID=A0ABX9QGE4_9BACT|nr:MULTISPECIES: ATP-dependent 6-phosphofructokinase [Corallococcus]RKH03535.1 6-phosphofructokinase [Corallococcus sp. CA047B]RKH26013.1 6-phosphofructokinase [Corallococcus sp. CA031C]RKI03322.1 6-phosphofructokinase [Corallococcus praedator]
MKVAVLTGGGDCPGLNAVIRAIVRRASEHGFEMMGLRDGWKGLLDDNHFRLTRETTSGILHRGGTILGTSRVNPFKVENGLERVKRAIERNGIHAVIAIGGEGTLSAATRMAQEGVRIVGVPKTIDNDLNGTDFTFGFDTAVMIATEAVDRLHSTAESHKRVIVCEVMGRHVGWIATYAGIAGGADVILVPEIPADLEAVAQHLQRRNAGGRTFSIVVVAEGTRIKLSADQNEQLVTTGALDEAGRPRLGGVGNIVASEIERRTGFETRVSVLGHIQRGGAPTAHDRVLATRFGVHACDMVARGEFGRMAALRGNEIVSENLAEATRELKRVPKEFFEVAQVFFG